MDGGAVKIRMTLREIFVRMPPAFGLFWAFGWAIQARFSVNFLSYKSLKIHVYDS